MSFRNLLRRSMFLLYRHLRCRVGVAICGKRVLAWRKTADIGTRFLLLSLVLGRGNTRNRVAVADSGRG